MNSRKNKEKKKNKKQKQKPLSLIKTKIHRRQTLILHVNLN